MAPVLLRTLPGILVLGIPGVSGRHWATIDPRGHEQGEEQAARTQAPAPGSIDAEKPTTGCEVQLACGSEGDGSGESVTCCDTMGTGSVHERVLVRLPGSHGEDLPPPLSATDEVALPDTRELACEHAFGTYIVGGSVSPRGREEIDWGWESWETLWCSP
ncbi:hypothetical protein C7212DRAFT_364988 [Tuber magnatum]|uniref:Hydrophobin n=1 Tax=Tuber magnatum TaxID=42249 RepID=A0A317SJG9_9PEZI|nr:hypothetical protein C7212DRAFT_364988 [Tuber magnatum]